MLLSHGKRFIYTKTVKTAGTSVESYFEPFCMRPGEWQFSHGRQESVSDAGIIGVRTGSPLDIQGAVFWNHMPAKTIRALLGDEIWNGYFKFCAVRNPFDKMVSAFRFFSDSRKEKPTRLRVYLSNLRSALAPSSRSNQLRADFENWLHTIPMPLDRNKYVIDGTFCMDAVIKFEELNDGLAQVCGRLGIDFQPKAVPTLKMSERSPVPLEAYYTPTSLKLVEDAYAYELEKFGYAIPWRGRAAA